MGIPEGLKFISMSAFSPWGTALLMVAFLVSCVTRTFLWDDALRKLYLFFSMLIVIYLLGLVAVFGGLISGNAASPEKTFVLMLFSMFFGVPCGVGWLMGWPIAVAIQLTLFGGSDAQASAAADRQATRTS